MKAMAKYKRSRQRERILEILLNTDCHPTAAWIYDQLRGEFSNLSMGTVYRNLNILVEQDRVQRIVYGSTFDRYDAKTEQHYHFICQKCQSIIDVKMAIDESLNERINSTHPFKAVGHQIQFFGVCETCLSA
jgi:Fur family transcriptional regulator, peroxide stress response regulator